MNAYRTREENFTHEQVFGHLGLDEFSAADAADYLEVSMLIFRRYVADGKLKASSEVGRKQFFSAKELKAFKVRQKTMAKP